MKTYVVISSIGVLENLREFIPMISDCDYKVILIDEGDELVRAKNKGILRDLPHSIYGPKERQEWFKQRFGYRYDHYLSVIPKRCHAETSFGFLVAYEENPDVIIELDDDVFPVEGTNLVRDHIANLKDSKCFCVSSRCGLYNTIENLNLNISSTIFPRGYPYAGRTPICDYDWRDGNSHSVLNMGLWLGDPDLDAVTILYYGGLNGRCTIKSLSQKKQRIIVDAGTFFPICSMNTSFLPSIIPAFYQLYMTYMAVDRYDDIWSGFFLKKIADHLNHNISLGTPLLVHRKTPRSTFKDLEKEAKGLAINESIWKVVQEVEIEGRTYWDCYNSLIEGMQERISIFKNKLDKDFWIFQLKKMRLWLEIVDKFC